MIKNITQGNGIEVMSGNSTYPYVNMSNHSAGMVRYNGTTSNFEIYDGFNWCPVTGSTTTINLDIETRSILEWAKKKRNEELELALLAETNIAIKDLVKQIEEKQEQIKVIATLVKTEIQHHRV